jgi:16S rRNA (guanine966-N2)-methyltransferase
MSAPRIIAGQYRGKILSTPVGMSTRPTNARARQAVFDILMHAPWCGPGFMQTARVLDVFAGTGAYGIEALSRGAAAASFIENSAAALTALRHNIAACKVEAVTKIIKADALQPPPGPAHDLIFLDPPYAQNLMLRGLEALRAAGYFAPEALFVTELGPEDSFAPPNVLTERRHGKARLIFWSD